MTDRLDDYQSHLDARKHYAPANLAWRAITVIIVTMFAAMKISTIVLTYHQHWTAWLLVTLVWWGWWRGNR